jgi:hypothetical protein
MERMSSLSPSQMARIAGALYLVNILLGAFAIGVVSAVVVVSGDPAATARNIQSHELLFRLGLAAHVVVTLTNIGLALLFYELFKVVNRQLAMLVVFFTLVATAIEAAGIAGQEASLSYSSAGYDVSTVFFGGYALSIGYLVLRSTFMPRAIGALMLIDGVAYLGNSFTTIVAPDFATHLVPYIQLPTLFGEGSLCLWMLIAGVDESRWRSRAAAAVE